MKNKIYNLYEENEYGEILIIETSSNPKKLEKIKDEIFFEQYVLRAIVISVIIIIFSILLGVIIGLEGENDYNLNSNQAGAIVGFMFGIVFSLIVTIVGILGGRIDFDRKYYVKYDGDEK